MKTWLAEFLIRLLAPFVEKVLLSFLTWLIARLHEFLMPFWLTRKETKKAEEEQAGREKQAAEDAGDAPAAQEAEARRRAAQRDGEFIRETEAAWNKGINEVAAEIPAAVAASVANATTWTKSKNPQLFPMIAPPVPAT